MRLSDLYRGTLTYRELWSLLQMLPQESSTQTILRDDKFEELVNPEPGPGEQRFGPWSLLNYQVASLTDAVARLEVTVARAFGADWKYPDPTPRPGLYRRVRKQSEDAVAYLKKLRGRG